METVLGGSLIAAMGRKGGLNSLPIMARASLGSICRFRPQQMYEILVLAEKCSDQRLTSDIQQLNKLLLECLSDNNVALDL